MAPKAGTKGLKISSKAILYLIPRIYLEMFISSTSVPFGKFVAKILAQDL